ncbi:hypothetical protein RUMOBE_00290 [Blautia obeum ATCC 29174]|uniref:Uncharacterized protein n=1 Tax=Blautia obeum ATCC 29174 TaxID=411459 RepID=A5ZMS3_9FIRM|nr:hypothetical protein RUMOBE_00290 [Blautia obeum ATCC 29174]
MCFYSKLFSYPIDKFKKERIINVRDYYSKGDYTHEKKKILCYYQQLLQHRSS